MQRSDFHFDLPEELIAQSPAAERRGARLLQIRADGVSDGHFPDITRLLRPGDLLVCNDTRVIPARGRAVRDSGGRVEILLERLLGERQALVQLRASKGKRVGSVFLLEGGGQAQVTARHGALFELAFDTPAQAWFEQFGHVPLPPYIHRDDEPADRERYQTVYARAPGAVAAPTAGLHFDKALLAELEAAGVQRAFLTLHVGLGTFAPLRVDDPAEHKLHSERVHVSEALCAAVALTRARGGRVVAVGTTSVRSLESAARSGELQPFSGETDLFIRPGFEFRVVDAIISNFHLPESTLLMLISAFAGRDRVLAAYRHAVEQRYRFFSYGDACWIEPSADGKP